MSSKIYLGDKVRVSTRHGSVGTATVVGFGRSAGTTTYLLNPNSDMVYGPLDRWELKTGGFHNRLQSQGVSGGELSLT